MKVGVIADDLTGANGTGVRLSTQGFSSATMMFYNEPTFNGKYDAICVDTDSRYAARETSTMRVKTVTNHFKNWGADIVCKRIDSTIRGTNIGSELETLLTELGEDSVAVVVSSFPDTGRITSGGYLLIDGIPVQETDVAKDPVAPLLKSYVPDILQKDNPYPVTHIGLETVLEGKYALEAALRKQIKEGNRVIVVDAVTEDEIERIAQTMARIKEYQLVPVDPGPLTAEYARAYSQNYEASQKILVTVGSVTSISKKQLHYLTDGMNADPVYANVEKLATTSDESWDEEVNRVTNLALQKIEKQDLLVITTNAPDSKKIDLKAKAKEAGVSKDFLAKRIADGLGKITRMVMEKTTHEIGGVFSSGGDITASICSLSRADGIKLEDEVLPLVAYGTLIGGHFDGLPIITKGGMIGNKKAMYTCIKFLLSKCH
ncbi:four-carbon acid sugar kinase family protein [Salinibacillus aidingensis]|uniref:Four-carbon acid sugar kinase family protein n=1 Tax=Salinibacillus aidingensis TaxID=237684 RepID=A0ABN1AWQ3_9BACI